MATKTMRFGYNFLFPPLFAFSLPYYFLRMRRRGNWRGGLTQRFGHYEPSITETLANKNVLWLHAVSVGEIGVCVGLLKVLESLSPATHFVVSTTTTTGMETLQKNAPDHVTKIYYPIDCRRYVRRALDAIHPQAIVLLEGEIWPNLFWQARERNIPIFLANARLSDRSFPRYKKFGRLFKDLFGGLTGVGAQSHDNASRLTAVGCPPENMQVTGNLKFDAINLTRGKSLDVRGLLARVGTDEQALLLVAGSTHEGEEELLAQELARLRKRFPNLVLILVPRHFERRHEVGRALTKLGTKFFFRSEITPETRLKPGSIDCLVVDSTGELTSFYQFATVVFIGKSLAAKGGQNPIEPAALGRPVIFGPNMQNFADVARLFVSGFGALQVRDTQELGLALEELLENPQRRDELGSNAARVVREYQGATLRTAHMILQSIWLNEGK